MKDDSGWTLTFSTRILLIFGGLGLFALFIAFIYATSNSIQYTQNEIKNALEQRHNTVQNLIENNLNILNTYLDIYFLNQSISALITNDEGSLNSNEILSISLRELGTSTNLDYFFLLSPDKEMIYNGTPSVFNAEEIVNNISSPISYSTAWRVIGTGKNTSIIRATPIFNPNTIELQGYLFTGLAIGQNPFFIQKLLDSADSDQIIIESTEDQATVAVASKHILDDAALINFSLLDDSKTHASTKKLNLFDKEYNLLVTINLKASRFGNPTQHFVKSFLIVSGLFLGLLITAGYILRTSHNQAISKLLDFINAIQQGKKEVTFKKTNIHEYNLVGTAMQNMVANLKVAAQVFESESGIFITDIGFNIIKVNKSFCHIIGLSANQIINRHMSDFTYSKDSIEYKDVLETIISEGSWRGEIWQKKANRESCLLSTNITTVRDEKNERIVNYVFVISDITKNNENEEKIHQLAFYDQLTNLPNRELLIDEIDKAIIRSQRNRSYAAILYIDLDDFKTLNDSLGHNVGDQLIQQVASELRRLVRASDTLARQGGDEFIMVIENLGSEKLEAIIKINQLCQKILSSMCRSYELDGFKYFCSLSIGTTLFLGKKSKVSEVLKQADLAMYQAKDGGRNTYRFFEASMQQKLNKHLSLASDLRIAIEKKEFFLVYQPQFGAYGNLIGAEALIRWQHPTKGLISPFEFIPVAEKTGLIISIGQWVIEAACKQLCEWQRCEKLKNIELAINISAKQFQQTDFTKQLLGLVSQYSFPKSKLKLEITESMLLANIDETIEKMNYIKTSGIKFSLDDFGTGYSSLSYLKLLPLDQLKIDKSFVSDMSEKSNHADIAKTIIALAHSLELEVIAEGVETAIQVEMLKDFGCSSFQGYYFNPPLSIEDFSEQYL